MPRGFGVSRSVAYRNKSKLNKHKHTFSIPFSCLYYQLAGRRAAAAAFVCNIILLLLHAILLFAFLIPRRLTATLTAETNRLDKYEIAT